MLLRPAGIPGYPEYYDWLVGTRLRPAVRVACLFVVGLNTFFLLLDGIVFPDRIAQFASLRFAWIVAMIGIFVGVQKFNPLLFARAGCVVAGLFLIGLSGLGGGATSSYWPALMVLFLGMPVLMPLTARQSAEIVSVLALSFASLPLFTGEPIDARSYGVPVFFVIATAIECVMSAAVLDGMRFSDYQSRQKVEEARDHLREMDKAKTRFTANIHHELRTPLTMILSPLAALRAGDYGTLPALVEGVVQTMESNGRRLHKLINNLLDLAKLESNEFNIVRRPMSLESLVDDVVAGVQPMARRKRIRLEAEGFESLNPLFADPEAIDKVVVNLVGNALKFTEEGGAITIWAGRTTGGGTRVEVRDTGVGIPPEQLSRVFDRFAQIDGSSTRRHEGTGIGLSLACELVELHAGRIWAESAGVGMGATMCFELPQGEDDSVHETLAHDSIVNIYDGEQIEGVIDGTQNVSELSVDRTGEIGRSVERWEQNSEELVQETQDAAHPDSVPEVLVVEDNPDMRKLLRFLLSREFRVRVARNGLEALAEIGHAHPHVVISDVMMPEMSGTELCTEIKGNELTSHIPVMLVTSKAEDEMRIGGLELGADDYLTKPFNPRELMARVRGLSRVRVLQEELEAKNETLENALVELKSTQLRLVRNERLAAVGEIAAGVAHEVNNPVNFALNAVRVLQTEVDEICEIAGVIQKVQEEGLAANIGAQDRRGGEGKIEETADTIRELAGIISDGLDRTHRLVGDLQDFSGASRRGRDRVDVAQAVASTVALLRPTLNERGIEIRVECAQEELPVEADVGALNQVFMNLLKNAADAVAEESGVVSVTAFFESDDVVVEISDNGPGIERDVLPLIFEPFYTSKKSGASAGTGLGLPISRQIVEEFGGTLTVESEVLEGARAIVSLPALKPSG